MPLCTTCDTATGGPTNNMHLRLWWESSGGRREEATIPNTDLTAVVWPSDSGKGWRWTVLDRSPPAGRKPGPVNLAYGSAPTYQQAQVEVVAQAMKEVHTRHGR